jgi:hypothetical protein
MSNSNVRSGQGVSMKNERQEKLMELRQTIRESLRQGKLKEFKKLVQRYFSILKLEVVDVKNDLDYRFYKQRTGR